MATMVLSAAGASLGGAVGGSVAGISAATLGRAFGSVAGGLIDQKVLGRGGGAVETGRVERLRLQSAAEGAAIPKLWGRMRLGGQLIWSSRFKENVDESRQGGKAAGPKTRAFSYTISFAVALCEGPIRRIGRVWADGNEVALSDYPHRLYRGHEFQKADDLIAEIEGDAPAFRGVAYIVFEDFPLAAFGNRIPQLNFEVFREPEPAAHGTPEETAPPLNALVQGVALSPGSGEFALETKKVRRLIRRGHTAFENVNTISERPDILVGLDQLTAEAPECGAVSLIVSWFGDDLRMGRCRIEPRAENHDKATEPVEWRAGGLSRAEVRLVSPDDQGRPVFGGTPSDGSVIRAIKAIRDRGLRVMFYPFILMDVPAENGLTDPWTGDVGQPAFPWRGRITLDAAPGRAESADKTAAAAADVDGFFGDAQVGDFAAEEESVAYSGPEEWSMRRFILHYAHLCALAGGVDAFCIGSEMRGLTQVRSTSNHYPAVHRLKALAGDVRSVLGAETRIGYAADWSEYFGHHPNDGTGDVFFHLDPLWSDQNVDFIGIDNYLPLADWRYREGHADADAGSVHSLAYLRGNVEGGEGYDWFYADAAARDAQARTPIIDTAHGEDWLFRPKDLSNWWRSPHHNRPGGVRNAQATEWSPESKPIWFTEIGCPAVDLGANQPNVFVDPKSSESFLPYFSRGVRDDFMQRRYLEAALSYWRDEARNPLSGSYGGRMVDLSNAYVWTWDARPWPDFPHRSDVWSDGANHRTGHWLTGRLGAASLADVVAEICEASGLTEYDVSGLRGVVNGYVQDEARTGRAALQPLMMAYAFDAVACGDRIRFAHRSGGATIAVTHGDMGLSGTSAADFELTREPEGEMPRAIRFSYVDGERDYEPGAVEASSRAALSDRVEASSAPLALDSGAARTIAERFMATVRAGRESGAISLGRKWSGIEPGDVIRFADAPAGRRYRVETVDDGLLRRMTLTRDGSDEAPLAPRPARAPKRPKIIPAAPVESQLIDTPLLSGGAPVLHVGAFAAPWTGAASFQVSADGEDFAEVARATRPAVFGVSVSELPSQAPARWTRGAGLDVRLFGGGLESLSRDAVLNGGNAALLRSPTGEWEVLQFRSAELIGEDEWRLTELLRGQRGTEHLIGDPTPAGADFVLMTEALEKVRPEVAGRGLERIWRIGPARKPVSHDSYTEVSAVFRGVGARPFAPAHLSAERLSGGDIRLSWVRRSRLDDDGWTGPDAPPGDDRELYRIRVGGVRTAETPVAEWTYSAALQSEDAVSGPVIAHVAQFSEAFGYGAEARIIINV